MKEIVRTFDLPSMVAYGAATWDWHEMHYDRKLTDELGLPGPIVDGQVFGALMAEQLQDHFGPGYRITELDFRFKQMVFASETVTVSGKIVEQGDNYALTEHTVTSGEKTAAVGKARVELRNG